MVIHANAWVVIEFFFQIFCDKIQQILQERQMISW